MQHCHVISSAADLGIEGRALKWLSSFLSGRTFHLCIGNALSDLATVQSGVIQGSTLGAILYKILINSLLRKLTLPSQGFADDRTFVADVIAHWRYRIQQEVDTFSLWTDKHCMPLSIEKCTVLHCGSHQPNNDYAIHNVVMKRVDVLSDLGVIRSCNGTFIEHCRNAGAKASRISGLIRHDCISLGTQETFMASFNSLRPAYPKLLLSSMESTTPTRHYCYWECSEEI